MEHLTYKEFLVLHNRIVSKFEQECKLNEDAVPTRASQIYGFDINNSQYNRKSANLVSYLSKSPNIMSYLSSLNEGKTEQDKGYRFINGKYLYDRHRDAQKEKEININGFYEAVYCKYLGYNDFQDFLSTLTPTNQYLIECKAYYYSFKFHEVRTFDLSFKQITDAEFEVEEEGLHEFPSDNKFIGIAKKKNAYLSIDLTNENGLEFKIIAYIGGQKVINFNYLMCAFITVTSDRFPLCARAILVNESVVKQNEKERFDDIKIKRYLMIKRKILRAPRDMISSLDDLKIRGGHINIIEQMIGLYRMWRFDDEGGIVQSKFIIHNDYKTFLYTELYPNMYEPQTCVLSVSTVFNHRLCVSTHPRRGNQVICYFMLDIPIRKDFKFIEGVFCAVGTEKQESIGRKLILMKEDDEVVFDARIIKKNELSSTIIEDQYLQIFYDKLAHMTKKEINNLKKIQLDLDV